MTSQWPEFIKLVWGLIRFCSFRAAKDQPRVSGQSHRKYHVGQIRGCWTPSGLLFDFTLKTEGEEPTEPRGSRYPSDLILPHERWIVDRDLGPVH